MKKKKRSSALPALLRPYRLRIAGLSLLAISQSLLQVTMAVLIRNVIDAAVSHSQQLWLWAGLFVADLVLQVAVHGLLSWATGSTVDRFSASLREKLLAGAVYSGGSRLQEFHSGALLSRSIEDVHTVCDGMIHALPTLVGQVARLIGAFVAVILIWPAMSGLLLAAALLAAAVIAALRPLLKAKHRKVRKTDEQLMTTLQEDLQKLELIQSLQCQQQTQKRFARRVKKNLKTKRERRVWLVTSNSVLSVASMLGTGVILLWGAGRVGGEGADGLSFGSLTSMLQLLSQFRGPAVALSGLWTRLASVEVAAERLGVLLDVQPEETCREDVQPKAVVFENVTFRYPGDEQPVVEKFSMRIALNGWNALSGISGRGKSTLFKLILGLYEPQEGRVYLETEKGEVPCSAKTRHLFAYVPQDYALFSGTVLENLRLVAPDAGEEDCRNALIAAQADFLWEQGQGLETAVGENNTGLSKGQLQRIAIARALLMGRQILLLDECTSALDGETEKKVLEKLRASAPAAILVTHRPEALQTVENVQTVIMKG